MPKIDSAAFLVNVSCLALSGSNSTWYKYQPCTVARLSEVSVHTFKAILTISPKPPIALKNKNRVEVGDSLLISCNSLFSVCSSDVDFSCFALFNLLNQLILWLLVGNGEHLLISTHNCHLLVMQRLGYANFLFGHTL